MWDAMWDRLISGWHESSNLLGEAPPVWCRARQRTGGLSAVQPSGDLIRRYEGDHNRHRHEQDGAQYRVLRHLESLVGARRAPFMWARGARPDAKKAPRIWGGYAGRSWRGIERSHAAM